jgi:hypothetical protein
MAERPLTVRRDRIKGLAPLRQSGNQAARHVYRFRAGLADISGASPKMNLVRRRGIALPARRSAVRIRETSRSQAMRSDRSAKGGRSGAIRSCTADRRRAARGTKSSVDRLPADRPSSRESSRNSSNRHTFFKRKSQSAPHMVGVRFILTGLSPKPRARSSNSTEGCAAPDSPSGAAFLRFEPVSDQVADGRAGRGG